MALPALGYSFLISFLGKDEEFERHWLSFQNTGLGKHLLEPPDSLDFSPKPKLGTESVSLASDTSVYFPPPPNAPCLASPPEMM